MQKALNVSKLIANWPKCLVSRAWMSETFASGVGSLQLVTWKFTMNKQVGDRQFPIRQSRRLDQIMLVDRRIILDDLCILVSEIAWSSIYRACTEKLKYQNMCAWVPPTATRLFFLRISLALCRRKWQFFGFDCHEWRNLGVPPLRLSNDHVSGSNPPRLSRENSVSVCRIGRVVDRYDSWHHNKRWQVLRHW